MSAGVIWLIAAGVLFAAAIAMVFPIVRAGK